MEKAISIDAQSKSCNALLICLHNFAYTVPNTDAANFRQLYLLQQIT